MGAPGTNTTSFGKLELSEQAIHAMRDCWRVLATSKQSHETIGRSIFSAFFENLPETKSMFKNSKSAHATKFMTSLDKMIGLVGSPHELKAFVNSVGFKHLGVSVNEVMAECFRSSVVQVLHLILGDALCEDAVDGFSELINYCSGALIYIRKTNSQRILILKASWTTAQAGSQHAITKPGGMSSTGDGDGDGDGSNSGEATKSPDQSASEGSPRSAAAAAAAQGGGRRLSRLRQRMSQGGATTEAVSSKAEEAKSPEDDLKDDEKPTASGTVLPTSFDEMFTINASVSGVKSKDVVWMMEVLETLDNWVMHSHDFDRFQEECDVMTIRLSKYPQGSLNLKQFRGCLLAALRSLLPKEWSSNHEDAWTWLWESIATVLTDNMDKPREYQKHWNRSSEGMDELARYRIRADIFTRFFELCPEGQDFFKQSNTRLHFIAEQVLVMCLEIFESPKQMVSDISALGLRHVGFGIPTNLFDPFCDACVDVIGRSADSPDVVLAFSWSLRLIARILVRTILEGSTVVMKAINANSVALLKKATRPLPRKRRAMAMLDIQVGDQHISPLAWSIEAGSLKVTEAILNDLLTIRADRARYYYGADELWQKHPDIVKKLQEEAPMLLTTLLEGLIWRSHRSQDGHRRVNYYVEHTLVKADGTFSDALACISGTGDPSLVSHPTVALLADCLWTGIVVRQFITSRMWNVFGLIIFIMSQEVLPSWNEPQEVHFSWLILAGRVFNYTVGLGRLAMFHLYRIWVWCRNTMRRILKEIDTDGNGEIDREEMLEALHKFKDTVKEEVHKAIKALREDGPGVDEAKKAIANREKNMYTLISLSLLVLLLVMLTHEPMFWCTDAPDWPTEYCSHTGEFGHVKPLKFRYSIFAMCAMAVHWLILIDLAVFSTEISAFLLVCGHVLAEVKQFLFALGFLILAFGSTISIWCTNCTRDGGEFNDMPNAAIVLFAMTVSLYQGDYRVFQSNPFLLVCVLTFVCIAVVLLLNLLVAQLNRSYEYIYADMLGFARLNRASLLVDAMESCSRVRWKRFVTSLHFEIRLEFDEGDLGLSGGLRSTEPAGKHLQTRESIRRFGGSTAGDAPWPMDQIDKEEAQEGVDPMDELEELVNKIARKVAQLALDSTNTASGGFGKNTASLSRDSGGDDSSKSGASSGSA